MNLTIDTDSKTITMNGPCNIQELYTWVNHNLGNPEDWDVQQAWAQTGFSHTDYQPLTSGTGMYQVHDSNTYGLNPHLTTLSTTGLCTVTSSDGISATLNAINGN